MRDYLRETAAVWKVLILFAMLTMLFYGGLNWVEEHQARFRHYRDPGDGAVSVIDGGLREQQREGLLPQRLIEFFRDGE